jgi:hypothetical protein
MPPVRVGPVESTRSATGTSEESVVCGRARQRRLPGRTDAHRDDTPFRPTRSLRSRPGYQRGDGPPITVIGLMLESCVPRVAGMCCRRSASINRDRYGVSSVRMASRSERVPHAPSILRFLCRRPRIRGPQRARRRTRATPPRGGIAVSRFFDRPGIAGKVSEFEQMHFSG